MPFTHLLEIRKNQCGIYLYPPAETQFTSHFFSCFQTFLCDQSGRFYQYILVFFLSFLCLAIFVSAPFFYQSDCIMAIYSRLSFSILLLPMFSYPSFSKCSFGITQMVEYLTKEHLQNTYKCLIYKHLQNCLIQTTPNSTGYSTVSPVLLFHSIHVPKMRI